MTMYCLKCSGWMVTPCSHFILCEILQPNGFELDDLFHENESNEKIFYYLLSNTYFWFSAYLKLEGSVQEYVLFEYNCDLFIFGYRLIRMSQTNTTRNDQLMVEGYTKAFTWFGNEIADLNRIYHEHIDEM